ncbi:hypothetical protein ncot_01580 [Nocardioides sp. JQ2195]|uniref:hypothetical protein n=1 Tax=Nocardioides sp. JQ2195 TaxID=2592334 RepID=UPI00143E15A2|nr:hypothetical protein [Nocardioides sp. JQ2195]QIX25424.1 hypothetical protein ncot_01580 [Nocardioides sp. JQ2195]
MPDEPTKKNRARRTVLATAGLTASASVIAAALLGAQAEADDSSSTATSQVQYGDPLIEDD